MYILCSGFYFSAFASKPFTSLFLDFSILHCISFGTVIRFLVPFHVHIFCLVFFVSNHFEFLFQSFWNFDNIGCQLSVIGKCIKPMLACKFDFIFYFYLLLKTCNFNYSNLLLLINFSFGKRHCNHQPQPHQWYLLKLTYYIKVKCSYEVIFFSYSIDCLDAQQKKRAMHFTLDSNQSFPNLHSLN